MTATTSAPADAALVRAAFAAWERTGDSDPVYDLVADDVIWRIIGTTPVSGTHPSKAAFRAATAPLGARFAAPLSARVTAVHDAGDTVVVQWRGSTRTVDGRAYEQDYCWVFRMSEGRAVEVVAYLDTALVDAMFAG